MRANADVDAERIIRVSLSAQMIIFDSLSINANSSHLSTTLETTKLTKDWPSHRRHRHFCRSANHFLDSLKNQDQLAVRLQQRDSQSIEKCKSFQRRFISTLRQRQNGRFSSEQTSSTKPKIRAPSLLLKMSAPVDAPICFEESMVNCLATQLIHSEM